MCLLKDVNCDMAEKFDEGREYVYFHETDCQIVNYWKKKNNCRTLVLYEDENNNKQLVDKRGFPAVSILLPQPLFKEIGNVWAGASDKSGTYAESSLIQKLHSCSNFREYELTFNQLSDVGYPKEILNSVPRPE